MNSKKNNSGLRRKHVPMRKCLGTLTTHPKRDLVRLVRTGDDRIIVDPTGKLSGSRGAYVSKSRAAVEAAIKHKRIEATFGRPLAQDEIEAILAYVSQFDTTESSQ
ncbi:MAG: YlxR family protein [Anaerolineae bacterium]|nr:YlxR family protein [Thermoflexales bacterium]MDW8407996.1 YlxR family protein [Anaerolineae bacterium]